MHQKLKQTIHIILTLVLLILLLLAGHIIYEQQYPTKPVTTLFESKGTIRQQLKEQIQEAKDNLANNWGYGQDSTTNEVTEGKLQGDTLLTVHFIDVGQADAILLQSDGHNMLIDAGNNQDGETVLNYLKQQGVGSLDYCIATHCHEDHIGGMDQVLLNIPIHIMIMTDHGEPTKSYDDVLSAIEKKRIKVKRPVVGASYELGNAIFTVLSPNGEYENNGNNWSIAVKVTCGENTFLFCGDMEAEAEKDLCENGYDITADVVKISHHGSNTSTTKQFLKAVQPKYAVISVGNGNLFGHPSVKTLRRLKKAGVKVYRTDLQGTIIIRSDGLNLDFTTGLQD